MIRRRPVALLTGVGALAGALAILAFLGREAAGPVAVRVPALSPEARAGRRAFERQCAQCHGDRAQGTATGPPLVHRIYHPGHHGDVAFQLAVRAGVRAHHWRFGDMPPQPAVTPDEVGPIVRFVRELQQANEIY